MKILGDTFCMLKFKRALETCGPCLHLSLLFSIADIITYIIFQVDHFRSRLITFMFMLYSCLWKQKAHDEFVSYTWIRFFNMQKLYTLFFMSTCRDIKLQNFYTQCDICHVYRPENKNRKLNTSFKMSWNCFKKWFV